MKQQQGFTLLELLIVVAIVGIMAGVAMLSIPGANFDDELERETRKITAQISLLQDEAIVQSREFGVGMWQNGYRFWAWHKTAGWQPVDGDIDFQEHLLPENIEIELSLVGQPLPLALVPTKGFPQAQPPKQDNNSQPSTPAAPDFRHNLPPIILYSSGEASTFEMQLRHPEAHRRWTVTGDIIGHLKTHSAVVEQ